MKKNIFTYLNLIAIISLVMVVFVSCSSSKSSIQQNDASIIDNNSENSPANGFTTHIKTIKTIEDFKHYFSFTSTPTYSGRIYSYNSYGRETISSHSSSTLTIKPFLSQFVEYKGSIKFKAKAKDESVAYQLLSDRILHLNYLGEAVDKVEKSSETRDDTSINYNNVEYSISDIDITITYHDEGASGIASLKYETITLTKYNFSAYLNVSKANNYVSFSSKTSVTGLYEYRDVKITFEDGTTVVLNALGRGTADVNVSTSDGTKDYGITQVEGYIDFYPPAIYEYI